MTSPDAHDSNRLSPLEVQQSPRKRSRSPHPYHRRSVSLIKQHESQDAEPAVSHESSESSTERGTEADDEKGTILRGLPPPPLRVRKGLRGSKTPIDLTPAISPFPTPPPAENEARSYFFSRKKDGVVNKQAQDPEQTGDLYQKYVRRRRAEIVRRSTESILLALIGTIACADTIRSGHLDRWESQTYRALGTVAFICTLYPLQHILRALRIGYTIPAAFKLGFHIPSRFDPGPLLYPVFVPFFISTSLVKMDTGLILVNLILGLSSLPMSMVPFQRTRTSVSLHWMISLIPIQRRELQDYAINRVAFIPPDSANCTDLSPEFLTLLFPLHQTLLCILKNLTTTSLDPAELHLLSVGLINVLISAASPQMQILKIMMWLGALCLFVFCHQAFSWEIALARIPSWKFARNKTPRSGLLCRVEKILLLILPAHRYRQAPLRDSDDEDYKRFRSARKTTKLNWKLRKTYSNGPASEVEADLTREPNALSSTSSTSLMRSATVPSIRPATSSPDTWSRRSASSVRSGLLGLTFTQAQALKWLAAGYIYVVVLVVVLAILRYYIGRDALFSQEPFGWAIGYLFGNIPQLRFWAVSNNLERWIKLPQHPSQFERTGPIGWLESIRQEQWGPANVRLLLAGYCLCILAFGIGVVLQLRSVVEVDTRRKVFHGIMVAMLLPTIPVDPCFISLALVLILAIFLLLDLFRACQLPPISKPLTTFLAPYVDGRDYRGPVIVSHIFLLIGCAIPLWLSLAGSPRSGQDPWRGWETGTREVSMVSGVVCVGMGDAAASLIGRRYGKTKWFWGGGKSLEGSLAFAVAVTAGLMASWMWLRLGGWIEWNVRALPVTMLKAMMAASGASLLESVLTAANDNVVVPIGLWLLVRGLQI